MKDHDFWNYRLIRRKYEQAAPEGQVLYEVHEAYYDKKGKIWGITEGPIRVHGESPDDVRKMLKMIERDIADAPILNYEDLPEKDAEEPGCGRS